MAVTPLEVVLVMVGVPLAIMITSGTPAMTKTTSSDVTALALTPTGSRGGRTAQASRQTLTWGWVSMIACPMVRSNEMVQLFFGTK